MPHLMHWHTSSPWGEGDYAVGDTAWRNIAAEDAHATSCLSANAIGPKIYILFHASR